MVPSHTVEASLPNDSNLRLYQSTVITGYRDILLGVDGGPGSHGEKSYAFFADLQCVFIMLYIQFEQTKQ